MALTRVDSPAKWRRVGAISVALVPLTVLLMLTRGADAPQRVHVRDDTSEKQAELRSPDLEGDISNAEDATRQPAFQDSGPAQDIATVKTQVPALLTADRATFRLPLDEQSIAERLGAPLDATWSSVARTLQYQEKYDAIKAAAGDPLFKPYSDNRFLVDSWSGVSVTADSAYALLEGHDEYLHSDGWTTDPAAQWQVHLTREAGEWKLSEVAAVQDGAN